MEESNKVRAALSKEFELNADFSARDFSSLVISLGAASAPAVFALLMTSVISERFAVDYLATLPASELATLFTQPIPHSQDRWLIVRAVWQGPLSVIRFMLAHGADPAAKNSYGLLAYPNSCSTPIVCV